MTDNEKAAPVATFCRNCGQPAGPRFCPHCGQEVRERRGPFLSVVSEVLGDIFSLDGRLIRSLTALAAPGRLTGFHLDGKRAPYLRPFRLYLLGSLVLFSTVLVLDSPAAETVDIYVADELVHARTGGNPNVNRSIQLFSQSSVFNRWLARRAPDRIERFRQLPPQEILDQFFAALRRILPASLIVFVPFLALGLKLLYLRRGKLYVDHLVFSLHFQSALFFALAATWLVTRVLRPGMMWSLAAYVVVALVLLTVYLGRALHNLHRQRWWITASKTVLLLFVYALLLGQAVGLCGAYAIWQV